MGGKNKSDLQAGFNLYIFPQLIKLLRPGKNKILALCIYGRIVALSKGDTSDVGTYPVTYGQSQARDDFEFHPSIYNRAISRLVKLGLLHKIHTEQNRNAFTVDLGKFRALNV